jgi:phospholipase C
MALGDIDTIVIAIMENRSFDHMLGYLSLDETPSPLPLDGLKSDPAWRASFANPHGGQLYEVKPLPAGQRIDDPPHGLESIAMQIDTAPAGPGPTKMGGFVASYATFFDPKKPAPADLGAVMGYYDAAAVPTFDFFARNYCVCDRWFAALPLGTQANRLVAMAGESKLVNNSGFPMPEHALVYDWLAKHKIKWCTYQSGGFLPFFTLMAKWIPEITAALTLSDLGIGGPRFRRYKRLKKEWNSSKPMPSVIFVEPQYGDGPHDKPNDDHPPTGVAPGQALLADLYAILTGNSARWAKTLLIVTYDEHGGFFDHVPPLELKTVIGATTLETTGPRVPAFLISPHVAPGSVFHEPLDHSSILQLLDDRFAGGKGYSAAVSKRAPALSRISKALLPAPRAGAAPAIRSPVAAFAAAITGAIGTLVAAIAPAAAARPAAPDTPNAEALDAATRKLAHDNAELLEQPGWAGVRAYLATNPPPDPEPALQK